MVFRIISLQKYAWQNRTAGLLSVDLLVLHLLPLLNPQVIIDLQPALSITLVVSLPEMAALVPLLHSHGRRTCYYNRLHNFSATIPRCHNNVYVNSFLPRKTKTLKFSDCRVFPLTYDLNGLNSRIKRHFFFGLFLNGFAISFYSSFSYNFMPRSGYSALHGAKKGKKHLLK